MGSLISLCKKQDISPVSTTNNNVNDTSIDTSTVSNLDYIRTISLLQEELRKLKQTSSNNDINDVKMSKDYQYLVFSGGGIKGIAQAGALSELEKYGTLYDKNDKLILKGIGAVSAGSIIAALLAIGYKPTELIKIVFDVDFQKIATDDSCYFYEAIDFFESWGVSPGQYLYNLLGDLIKAKVGNPDYSLENLYNDTGIKLVIVTTNLSYQKTEYLYAGNPIKELSNIPIRKAVRMSMGIPFQFEPYFYNECYYVDGGLLDNYPIHIFDGEYPGDRKARLNLCEPNPHVLGIKIITNDRLDNYDIVPKQDYDNLYEYAAAFVNTFLVENDRRIMTYSFWIRSIIIITPDYPLTQFTLTQEQKNELITLGTKYTQDFFNN